MVERHGQFQPWGLTVVWPWTWPLFHRYFGAQTIYYWCKLRIFGLYQASFHVGIQRLSFHACLVMHFASKIIQLPGSVMTLVINPRILEQTNCFTVKLTWKSLFLGVSVPGKVSILVIALECILESVQDLDLKKCGFSWRLSNTKLPDCRTFRTQNDSHFVWNCIKNSKSEFLKMASQDF